MNWDAIAAISSIVSTIAVVLSVIYLALQVRHSNKLSASQTRMEMRHMASTEVMKIVDNPGLFRLYWQEELNEDERIQLHAYLISCIRFREFIWRQHDDGLLDTPTFQNYSRVILQQLGSKRNRDWWNNFKNSSFDPRFVAYVDDLLANNPPLPVKDLVHGNW